MVFSFMCSILSSCYLLISEAHECKILNGLTLDGPYVSCMCSTIDVLHKNLKVTFKAEPVFFLQVAERTLFLWNNEHLFDMISQNRQVILPLIYPALEWNTRWHWNQSVLNVTLNVRKMFLDVDEKLLLSCQSNFQEEEEKRAATEERRRLMWEQLERSAAHEYQSVIADTSFPSPSSVRVFAPTVT
jgi:hypothetical protein